MSSNNEQNPQQQPATPASGNATADNLGLDKLRWSSRNDSTTRKTRESMLKDLPQGPARRIGER